MKKLSDSLNDKDFLEGVARRFVEEQKAEYEELKSFYKSKEFYEVINLLPDSPLSEECLAYGLVESSITLDQFNKLTRSIVEFNEGVDITDNSIFPTVEWVFENIKVTHMYGQGTSVLVEKIK